MCLFDGVSRKYDQKLLRSHSHSQTHTKYRPTSWHSDQDPPPPRLHTMGHIFMFVFFLFPFSGPST